jgi:hypothetical protein
MATDLGARVEHRHVGEVPDAPSVVDEAPAQLDLLVPVEQFGEVATRRLVRHARIAEAPPRNRATSPERSGDVPRGRGTWRRADDPSSSTSRSDTAPRSGLPANSSRMRSDAPRRSDRIVVEEPDDGSGALREPSVPTARAHRGSRATRRDAPADRRGSRGRRHRSTPPPPRRARRSAASARQRPSPRHDHPWSARPTRCRTARPHGTATGEAHP